MELEIPQGEIIDNDLALRPVDNLDEIFALWAAGKAFNHLGGKVGRYDSELLDIRLDAGGRERDCTFYVLELPRPTIVACLTHRGKLCYALFRDTDEWKACTKLLLLPSAEDEPAWGDDDEESFVQCLSRVVLFAGLASINGWYEPLSSTHTPA